MVRWVVGSILHGGLIELFLVPASAPLSYFSFQPVPTTGVTKAVVCAILSVGWCI